MEFANILTREEMKEIKGGSPGCHLYCCTHGGTCSSAVHFEEAESTTHEGCQSEALEAYGGNDPCTGGSYLAALYM